MWEALGISWIFQRASFLSQLQPSHHSTGIPMCFCIRRSPVPLWKRLLILLPLKPHHPSRNSEPRTWTKSMHLICLWSIVQFWPCSLHIGTTLCIWLCQLHNVLARPYAFFLHCYYAALLKLLSKLILQKAQEWQRILTNNSSHTSITRIIVPSRVHFIKMQ